MNDLDMNIEKFIGCLSLFYCLLYIIYIFINPTILTHWIFPFIAWPCVTEMLLYPLTYITPIFTYSLVIATTLFCLFPQCTAYIMFPCLFFTITAISNISIRELLIKNLEDDEFQLRSILLNFSGPIHHGIKLANKSDINHIKIIISKLINFKLTSLSQKNELIQNDPSLLKMVIDRAERGEIPEIFNSAGKEAREKCFLQAWEINSDVWLHVPEKYKNDSDHLKETIERSERDNIPQIFNSAGEKAKKECFLEAWEKNSIIWLDAPDNFKNQDTMLEKTLSDPFNVLKIGSIFQSAGKEAQEKCYLSAWNKTPTVFIYAPEIYKNDSDHLKETIERSEKGKIPQIFNSAGKEAREKCFLQAWEINSDVWLHVPEKYKNDSDHLKETLERSERYNIPQIFLAASKEAQEKCYLLAWNKNPTVFIYAPEKYKNDSDHLKETIKRSANYIIPEIFKAAGAKAKKECFLEAWEENFDVWLHVPDNYMNDNLTLELTLKYCNISLIPEIFSVAGEEAQEKCYLLAWNKNPTVFIDAPEIYKSDSDHLKETIERSERDNIPQIFLAASKEAQEKCYLQASEKNSEVSKFAPEKYRTNAPHFILVN